MITKVEASSPTLFTLPLPLHGTFSDPAFPNGWPIEIRKIDGLGPEKANIAVEPLATGRGAVHQGSSTPTRNIILTLGFNPDWDTTTISNLRQALYMYFMPEQPITLKFFSDDLPDVGIDGVVESLDPNIFEQDPEMQISIICPEPDFVAIEAETVVGWVPNSLTDGVPVETAIYYTGTAPTGFELQVRSSDYLSEYNDRLIVVNKAPTLFEVFDVLDVDIEGTRYFRLSTIRTKRKVEEVEGLYVDGEHFDILAKMVPSSKWLELKPGENNFALGAISSGLSWAMQYHNRYGGI